MELSTNTIPMAEEKTTHGRGVHAHELSFHLMKATVVPYSAAVARAPRPEGYLYLLAEPPLKRRRRLILPEDVMPGILVRLLARSVVRFRPACKLFHAITSDPSFIHSHAARAAPAGVVDVTVLPLPRTIKHALLYFIQPKEDAGAGAGARVSMSRPATIGYPAEDGETLIYLDASCDGMLCFREADSERLLVCNPLIRGDWIRLPDYSHRRSVSVKVCGFYFHASTGEYRLLRSMFCSSPRRCRYEVLTLGTNTWRVVDKSLKWVSIDAYNCCVSAHGRLYWMSADDPYECDPSVKAFDTETEKFEVIRAPVTGDTPQFCHLITLGESVGLCHCRSRTEMTVYVLKDHAAEAWEKLYTISVEGIQGPPCWKGSVYEMTPMLALKDQGILFRWNWIEGFKYGMIFYDSKLNTLRTTKLDEGFFPTSQVLTCVNHRQYIESPICCSLFEERRGELPCINR